jgi:ribosomal protein S12 methylthiotransferase accessory factor
MPVLPSFEEELQYLRERVEAVGAGPVLSVDLSQPGRPFHVLRAIVPGLEGSADSPGYAPGARARAVQLPEAMA